MVKVIIHKSSKRSSVGITISNETNGTSTFPFIRKIDPDGICANTALRVGMRVWSVNGLRCYNKDDTNAKLKRAPGTCHIEAQLVDDEVGRAAVAATSISPAARRGRGVIRSLTPKKWKLPSLRSSKSLGGVDLVRAETGDMA